MKTALPIQHRPFNADHARAGAPFACCDGTTVEILKWDRAATLPIVGIINDRASSVMAWNLEGNNANDPDVHLAMLPLGYIDGKPVFVGDQLEQRDRHNEAWIRRDAQPCDRYTDNGEVRWPAPAKVYPQTKMTTNEMFGIWDKAHGSQPLFAVANAALRHAIDAGQVVAVDDAKHLTKVMLNGSMYSVEKLEVVGDQMVAYITGAMTKAEHEAALTRLGDQLMGVSLGSRAARDMAIAEAVQDATYRSLGVQRLISPKLDLAAIIAKVHS